MSDDKAICQRLLLLCGDVDNHAFVAKEQGCMTGLVRYLDSASAEIASMAARAIWYLSSSPSNRPTLMAQPGLYDKLQKLNSSANEAVRHNASKALANLSSAPTEGENSRPTAARAASTITKPRALTMKVDGLETASVSTRDAIVKSLLSVSGVTSVTIDQRKGQAIVYTKQEKEVIRPSLLGALEKVGKSREPFRALDDDLDYLDEGDDDTACDGAIAQRTGRTSLEARLAQKREKQQTHLRKRDMVKNALGRVFGSFW